jgi:hypothetical protein
VPPLHPAPEHRAAAGFSLVANRYERSPKEDGRLASPLGPAGDGTNRFNLMAQPTPQNLKRLAELLDNRTLRVPIERSY